MSTHPEVERLLLQAMSMLAVLAHVDHGLDADPTILDGATLREYVLLVHDLVARAHEALDQAALAHQAAPGDAIGGEAVRW